MTSKERVLLAINHKEPDRVPLDFYATPEVWQKLREFLRVDDNEGVLQHFQIDFRFVEPSYKGLRENISCDFDIYSKQHKFTDGTWEDFWGIRYKPQKYNKGFYDEVCFYPLAKAETVEDIENYLWPSTYWFNYSNISKDCERYKDYAIYTGWPSIFQLAQSLYSMDRLLLDLALKPELVKALFAKITDFYCEWLRRTLKSASGKIDLVNISDDLGTQKGLLISREMFQEFVAPYWQRIIKICKDFRVKIWLHSCGSIRDLIPDFIELGIDMLDPVQVSAEGMVPKELKKLFGDKIAFHGAIDTQQVLPHGTVEDVKKEVRQRIKELAAGGGYVLLPVHAVQPDVPLENILAVYETALTEGRY